MRAEEVIALYTLLAEHGVCVWIDGGWGIDALLGEQTRPHKDLDALVSVDDLDTLVGVLADCSFTLKEIWEENRWVAHAVRLPLIGKTDHESSVAATAFVLRNGVGHELDVHALTFDNRGYGIPAWNANVSFPPDATAGCGVIAGTPVRCLSARMQMLTHTGYPLQAKDLQDLLLLHQRFGIPYLKEQAHHFPDLGS